MSVTQGRFGPSALNWRLTRSVTIFWDGTRLARRRSGSHAQRIRPRQSRRVCFSQFAALRLSGAVGLSLAKTEVVFFTRLPDRGLGDRLTEVDRATRDSPLED
jgi:hypothetical protein